MTDVASDIRQLLADDAKPVAQEWLDQAIALYPYFPLPTLLALQRQHPTPGTRAAMLARLAITCPDRLALYDAAGEDAGRFAEFYPPEPQQATPSTDDTITAFLDRYGNGDDEKEISALEKLIFNPVPDYSTVLAAQEERSQPTQDEISGEGVSENDARVNSFIAKSKQRNGHFPATVVDNPASAQPQPEAALQLETALEKPRPHDNSTLSESLAKIYIKQRKYDKALEIIKNISLNFPEKSIYFADQIRFLKKLIAIEQIRNKK